MATPLSLLAMSIWLAGSAAPAVTNDEGRMLIRNVTIGAQHIVFSYAGDLWRVGHEGGAAEQLTSGPEDDDFPVLSPNGGTVAFSRRGADDWDVYTILVTGGAEATRVTHNPEADIARGWTVDGDGIVFLSARDEEFTFRLYVAPTDGTLPSALPFDRAWDASYSPDGSLIAYVPISLPSEFIGTEWRNYRGGMASRIEIANLGAGQVDRVYGEDSNDRDPMWIGNHLFFVSDRSGTFNIHSLDTRSRQLEQLTAFELYGVESAAAGGGLIAFVHDGQIKILEPGTSEVRTLQIQVDPDSTEMLPRTASGGSWVLSAAPSAGGDRVALGMRGDVVMLDVATGGFENLTGTPGAAERDPAISPDGQFIAYFSDESGEYQLRVQPTSGEGSVRSIPVELRASYYRELTWSPDSKRIAFSDKRLRLWVADVETGGARRVTESNYSFQDLYQPSWSPDGVWLAYSRYESNRQRAIHLYHAVRGRKTQVTGGRVNAEHPIFDRSGRYLYFIASNTARLGEFGWSVLSGRLLRPQVARRIHTVVLREGMPAPVLPVTGEPNPSADSMAALPPLPALRRGGGPPEGRQPPAGQQRAQGPPGQGEMPTGITVRGIGNRIVPLPLPAKDYARLVPGDAPGVFYVLVTEWPPSPTLASSPSQTVYRYDLRRPSELTELIADVDEFIVSADGASILYKRGSDWGMVSGREPAEPGTGVLDLSQIAVDVDPAAEWQQIYREAWRLMDDYFYDPEHHGRDLRELEQHYAAYLPSITRRADLNLLLRKTLGQVSVSYLSVEGGDIPTAPGQPGNTGMLGADYEIDQGRYRINRIYASAHFNSGNPLLQAPLDQPGVFVRPTDYLIAIDGVEITPDRNIYTYFEGKALKPTRLTVAPEPDGSGARTYTVVPLPSESVLRRWNWAGRNARIVADESQGILGYIYVSEFTEWGVEAMFQQLLDNADKRGLIIDQRFAGGDITADYIIQLLVQRPLFYYAFRHGDDIGIPANPLPLNKVLIINDMNAFAAETFALMFKLGNVGEVVGARTSGAGIGPYAYIPPFIDGGIISIPNRAAYNPDGTWDIENSGVEPDIEVPLTTVDYWEGRDPQLGTAIRTVLQMIVNNPPTEVKKPDYPVRSEAQDTVPSQTGGAPPSQEGGAI